MRVRVRRDPEQGTERWLVETKASFFSGWRYTYSCWGNGSKERALQTADLIINPKIIEIEKR